MTKAKQAALFLSSLAGIAYEIYVMRVFSISGWSAFGSLVLSAALLGVGLSGIFITLFSDKVEKYAQKILKLSSVLLLFTMPLSVYLAQMVPFNPMYLSASFTQVLYIGLYYIIYGVPFFLNAAFTGIIFFILRKHIQKLYFWNMIGSGTGGLFIVSSMFFLPPEYLLLPILLITLLSAILIFITYDDDTKCAGISIKALLTLCAISILSVVIVFASGSIKISESKAISYVRKYPDAKLVHHSYSPGGEYHVYYSKYFHFAPGLSDNAALQIPVTSQQPYWGLFIDGSGPIGVMGYMRETEQEYMDYLPMSAPYTVLNEPKVLLINLSGGINTQIARYKNASHIDILEPSGDIIKLLKYDKNITRFNAGLLTEKNINIVRNEGRVWARNHKNMYDLIEISLVDSVGLTDCGTYPVSEDYKWTVEAFKEYIGALKHDGILSVTVWDKVNPPRNVLKLTNTISAALKELRVSNREDCFFSFGLFMSTTSLIVKKNPLTNEQIKKLTDFTESCGFELYYVPDRSLSDYTIEYLLSSVKHKFLKEKKHDSESENFIPSDLYKAAIPALLSGYKKNTIEKTYIFDIQEIRDTRPYYGASLKFDLLSSYLKDIDSISEEWAYLLLLGILLQALVFASIVIIIPIIVCRTTLFKNQSLFKTCGVIIYYASLGLGYMLVEVFLIQRFSLFLSSPIYATSIVITAMLIFSGIGSLASIQFNDSRKEIVLCSAGIIAVVLIFYMTGLNDILTTLSSASFFVHVLVSILLIAPAAFFMGIPYPNGLDSLQASNPQLLPWAWGMNGGLSVAGSALARLISVANGFFVLLCVCIALYLIAGILFFVNEKSV
ncbi:MAG: hypothetical protein Ta2F_07110 [Termitinemataceae bacterium]|nr:MAG: hypothetical protein Ta2F_07110 [Termitinemataceae bacterium]